MAAHGQAGKGSAAPGAGALEGLRVVDLSRFIAGPYCAMLLGDMGADVVKVEPPGRGENSRAFGPFVAGESLYTMVFNRNKRSLTCDLRSDEGKELLRGLLRSADVLVENYVPGTLEKMGFDWDTLQALNPRLIVTRISGFGQSGPLSRKPCFDVIGQTMSGLMDITGDADGRPTMSGTYVVDYSTGLYATIGTLGALQARARTGSRPDRGRGADGFRAVDADDRDSRTDAARPHHETPRQPRPLCRTGQHLSHARCGLGASGRGRRADVPGAGRAPWGGRNWPGMRAFATTPRACTTSRNSSG